MFQMGSNGFKWVQNGQTIQMKMAYDTRRFWFSVKIFQNQSERLAISQA